MLLFTGKKLDPILRLKLKEKTDKIIPSIIMLKVSLSNKLKSSISKNNGKIKYEYKYMNGFSADLPPEYIDKLSEFPEVAAISYDRKANICMDMASTCIGVKLDSSYNLTGRNVTIAVIDTGVYPHGDLLRPYKIIKNFKDFINSCDDPYDDNGHGTHICGVISGSGSMSEGRYRGVAPGSKIVMLKAFNSVGEGSFSHILAAIGWVIENKEKYGIRILCLPFGADSIVSHNADPLCIACSAAWNCGIIIVAAAGNKGPNNGTITTPGIEPVVITAGCCSCAQSNVKSWDIPQFSGRGGQKEQVVKPDLIAPGVNITSLSSGKSYFPFGSGRMAGPVNLENPYTSMTGSSVSSAVTAGCIALLLEKNPDLVCNDLKGILKLSCQTINEVKTSQGYGVINLKKLLNE